MAGDDKQGLDALMASMGVRPLRRDERTHQKPRKKDARAPKKSSAPASPKISAPKASAVSAALPQSAPAATDDATEKKLRALRDANAALEKRLAETTQQLGDLRASHSDLEKEVETLDRERRVLQRRVESSANGTQSPPPR